jgi:hypothetical protein
VGQLVHEGDAGGEHGVAGVFGELCTFDVHGAGALVVAIEGGAELARGGRGLLACGVIGHAKDHAVWAGEVFHGDAFCQELGVADDGEPQVWLAALGQFFTESGACFAGGAYGHVGLTCHRLEAGRVAANVAGGDQHVLQVGAAAMQLINRSPVHLEPKNVIAQVGQANPGDRTDAAGADDGDAHCLSIRGAVLAVMPRTTHQAAAAAR